MSEITEEKLKNIIETGKSKVIYINGKKEYLNKKLIIELKESINKNEEIKEGGILPLIPLLLAIFAVLGVVGGVTGGVATAVQK